MKHILWVFIAVAALASCTQNTSTNTTADTAGADSSTVNTTNCFLRTEGLNSQDSTRVSLTTDNGMVSGTYDWLPYEKDSRKGTLSGTVEGDIIKATWKFMQEGIQDSMQVEFKRSGSDLLQKKFTAGPDGKMITAADADYTESFAQVECN